MTGLVLSGLLGVVLGALVTAVVAVGWVQRVACPDPEAHELSEGDREAVTAEFAAHASEVQRQVSEYADVLAGEDVELREQLRRFEGGAAS